MGNKDNNTIQRKYNDKGNIKNKKTKIISMVAIVALTLTIITATYANFNASVGYPASSDIKLMTIM